jgi:titin
VITAAATDSGSMTGSATRTITVTSNQTPPAAPTNLTLTNLGSNTVQLNWTDNSTNESNFQIQREHRVGSVWGSDVFYSVGANVTQFSNLAGNGRWRYRVRAQNGAGDSAWTAWKQIQL